MSELNLPESNWKADEEKKNQLATKPPQAILDLPKSNPGRKELTDEQLKDAKNDLLDKSFIKLKYPREQKFRNDPTINGQHFGLITFIPSKGATPDTDGCFGVMKFRGAFSTSSEAEGWAEELIRKTDSLNEIDVVYIGREFPVMTDNSMFTSTTREIDTRKKVDDVVKADKRAKQEKEQKEIEEVTKRQQKLLDKTHEEEKEQTFDDIEYYTMLRVKKAQALALIDDCEKKANEAKSVIESAEKDIQRLDELDSTFKDQYLAKYEQALNAVGTKLEDNPLVKFLK